MDPDWLTRWGQRERERFNSNQLAGGKNSKAGIAIYNNVLPFPTESFAATTESPQAPLKAAFPESRPDREKQNFWQDFYDSSGSFIVIHEHMANLW